ncbi:MAG: enoyl-CoA hydratase/isomerase family protein [Deltaproteobacteria bacterium]|nr:enoyl-CoA hydratase/isomerase family protein [Deltaproteobacteria bacterium]
MVPKDAQVLTDALHDGVLRLTLNRPEKLNALDQAMVDALHAAMDYYAGNPDVRVLVLAGAGDKAFAAGADIAQLRDRRAADALRAINAGLFERIAAFPCPTVAAVRGFALGGGCELALACDLRVCGLSAKFGQPETGLGIMAAAGATWRLAALIGLGRARELLYTGRLVDAQEAHAIGLANQVVPDEELDAAVSEMAGLIARNDPLATRLTKQAIRLVQGPEEHYRQFASAAQAVCFESPEKVKRMDAFLERKKRRA